MREVISTQDAPRSPLYSQAVKAGQHVYVSGLVGLDTATGNLAGSRIQEQTRQALTNCEPRLTLPAAARHGRLTVEIVALDAAGRVGPTAVAQLT